MNYIEYFCINHIGMKAWREVVRLLKNFSSTKNENGNSGCVLLYTKYRYRFPIIIVKYNYKVISSCKLCNDVTFSSFTFLLIFI